MNMPQSFGLSYRLGRASSAWSCHASSSTDSHSGWLLAGSLFDSNATYNYTSTGCQDYRQQLRFATGQQTLNEECAREERASRSGDMRRVHCERRSGLTRRRGLLVRSACSNGVVSRELGQTLLTLLQLYLRRLLPAAVLDGGRGGGARHQLAARDRRRRSHVQPCRRSRDGGSAAGTWSEFRYAGMRGSC